MRKRQINLLKNSRVARYVYRRRLRKDYKKIKKGYTFHIKKVKKIKNNLESETKKSLRTIKSDISNEVKTNSVKA